MTDGQASDGPQQAPFLPQLGDLAAMIRVAQQVQKEHQETLAAVVRLHTAIPRTEILELLSNAQKIIDSPGMKMAISGWRENQRNYEMAAQMLARSVGPLRENLARLGWFDPIVTIPNELPKRPAPRQQDNAGAKSAPASMPDNIKEVLAAVEAVRDQAVDEELASEVEAFFDEDAEIDKNVTGLALDFNDPEVQKRVIAAARYIITLAVITFIASNWEAASGISTALGLFGYSAKDASNLVAAAIQRFFDKQDFRAEDGDD